ncbi:MAG: hypothetical protein PVJ64_02365 [Gemmatimonadales bacterium]|jgi:hypothetical protein
MLRRGYLGTNTVLAAATLLGLTLAAGFSACADEPTRPAESAEEAALSPGVNVYLTLDNEAATPGSHITVTGKVRAVGVELTPTGYFVDLLYDPEKLEPVAAATLDDEVLRAINLEAGPGLVKAAGAAANGLKSDVLFELEMKVKAEGYADGLEVQVHELTVLEKNFMDVSPDVVIPPQAVIVSR